MREKRTEDTPRLSRLSFEVPASLHWDLKVAAAKRNITVRRLMTRLILRYLESVHILEAEGEREIWSDNIPYVKQGQKIDEQKFIVRREGEEI